MGGKRRKTRTHVKDQPEDLGKVPRSFVVKSGVVGNSLCHLVKDFRRVMEPNTASKLRERKGNKLRDFLSIASHFGVTHSVIFSRTEKGPNLRIARFPRGPTVHFQIASYSLTKDVLALQKTPKSPGNDYKTAPLIVLNNFSPESKHMKLVATILQNLFPTINVSTIKLAEARRVVLFNYNSDTNEIEMRHYGVNVKMSGVSKSIKSVIQTTVPNLQGYDDISEFVLRGAFASESDVEDGPDVTMPLPQKYIGKGNKQSENRSIRLAELGPRMGLKLVKIQEGLCDGEVIHHEFVKKTQAELKKMKAEREKRARLKAERRKEQERNVARKNALKKKPSGDDGDDDDDDDRAYDQGDDDDEMDGMDEDE
ncbi:Brix domain-containing protein [Polychytrium aggregatum]|uniref:Brix domain-containing protein n=1 Tax=Polychytrium aggregatum TaxID=110093 RepID=UPI0022FEFB1C|nr:Brix domain-containing protein [Polychytrium aggregatum]KAI9202126.1 Brix domain-containing protein [Polychytrium aggregatum]